MEKETAVEWFAKQLYERFTIKGNGRLYELLLEQAKEMEKQEIIDAWDDGHDSFSTRNAEQYYNETFGKL
jgi:hypothetical protein